MMQQIPQVPMDIPATYRICVTGGLERSWVERFWGMRSIPVGQSGGLEQTELIGEVADQAALIGVINALYNMGHTVVSIERILADTDLNLNDTNKEDL